MVCVIELDARDCAAPSVRPHPGGGVLVCFGAPGGLAPLAEKRLLVTVEQLAHLVRTAKEGS